MDVEKKRQREQETVAKIIEIYCHDHHGKRSGLCPKCEELAHYAEARLPAHGGQELLQRLPDTLLRAGAAPGDPSRHALRRPAHAPPSPAHDLAPYDAVVADALRALCFFPPLAPVGPQREGEVSGAETYIWYNEDVRKYVHESEGEKELHETI